MGWQTCRVIIICFKIFACSMSVNVFSLLFYLFIMRIIVMNISIHITIIYICNPYNYSKKYQIINYFFKGYLIAQQWDAFFYLLSLIGSFYLMFFVFTFVLLLLFFFFLLLSLLLFFIIITCFVFNPFCKCMC